MSEHGRSRVGIVGLRHRLLFADSPGPSAEGTACADSLGHGRRRTGRHRPGQARRGRDLRHRGHREQARAIAEAGRQGRLRFSQLRLVRRVDGGHGGRGCRRRPELPCRAPRRALPARPARRRLALRDRQGRRLRRQRHRLARLPQEPPLRGHRRGSPHGRRPVACTQALAKVPRPARPGSAAPPARHRLSVPGLRQGPPPDDHRATPGKAGPQGARRPARIRTSRSPTCGRCSTRMRPTW